MKSSVRLKPLASDLLQIEPCTPPWVYVCLALPYSKFLGLRNCRESPWPACRLSHAWLSRGSLMCCWITSTWTLAILLPSLNPCKRIQRNTRRPHVCVFLSKVGVWLFIFTVQHKYLFTGCSACFSTFHVSFLAR